MSERGDNDLVIAMLVLAILVLAVFLSYHITQTRDLQRRVGQNEETIKRLESESCLMERLDNQEDLSR